MPKAACEEEMQNTQIDNNEVTIEYITDSQGNKVKKLKPIIIKSEPDRDMWTVMSTFLLSQRKISPMRGKE